MYIHSVERYHEETIDLMIFETKKNSILLYCIVYSCVINHSLENAAIYKSWMKWGEINDYECEEL